MLSLRFPTPIIECTLSPPKPKPIHFFRTNRTSSIITFSPLNPLPKLLATATDKVAKEEGDDGRVAGAGAGDSSKREQLPVSLRPELMPKHVAIIMDGNVRWAQQRGLSASLGHEAGVRALLKLIKNCRKWEIKVLTVFTFSSENWIRPKVMTDSLMRLIETALRSNLEDFAREGIRISTIGETTKLPQSLQKLFSEADKSTKDNPRLHLIWAISYSGQYDIVQACKSIGCNVRDGLIQIEDINEELIEQKLETNCTEFPHPDFLIRTSGEFRISNFFLWQLAYTELFFAPNLWPDFGEPEFIEALSSFQKRDRRYGQRIS